MYRRSVPDGLSAKQRGQWYRAIDAAQQLHDALFPED